MLIIGVEMWENIKSALNVDMVNANVRKRNVKIAGTTNVNVVINKKLVKKFKSL